MSIIELKNISKIYKGGDFKVCALSDISLTINEGDMVAIVGTSGSGKTTLLNILALIDNANSGDYILDGVNVCNLSELERDQCRNKKIGFIIQDFALIERYTALENAMVPLEYTKISSKTKKLKATKMLDLMQLSDKVDRYPRELSGGQKQRVAISRALINEANIILADEPTGALDSETTDDIMSIFKELNKNGHTIIIVTHDPNVANQCDFIYEIKDGRLL